VRRTYDAAFESKASRFRSEDRGAIAGTLAIQGAVSIWYSAFSRYSQGDGYLSMKAGNRMEDAPFPNGIPHHENPAG